GEYLKVTDTSVTETTCPAGSYCVGGGYTVETANNSIAQCPAEYPNSAEGAGTQNQCYTACTVATANIAHATAVSGNDYFGTGVDTCGATACETGYHVDGGGIELVEKTPLAPISLTGEGVDYGYISADGNDTHQTTEYGLTANNTWATEFAEGTVYGKASCQSTTDPASVYIFSNIEAIASGTMSMEEFRTGALAVTTEDKADVIVDLAKAYSVMMTGQGDMTEAEIGEAFAKYFVTFSESSDKNYSTDSTGQYCYCQMDGFTPTGGTKEIVTSAPWVFNYVNGSADGCADFCAINCAGNLRNVFVFYLAFRAALVGSLGAVSAGGTCAANVLNIVWDPANDGAVTENQCTYNEAITVPADPVKPGYTFMGWKLKTEN
ncbi:MAG: InlB B-repeat-containing protein, partial [Alphaproteobacteria bacterium]|nr:InlB B-repeat-containing protein [Alphaproteobacteria bacterium]